jgi:hypothetical protein
MTKLTLSADPATVELAKKLAAEQGTSVSAMFERFVSLVAAQRTAAMKVGPLTRGASGIVRLPKGTNAHRVLEDALLERHKLD